MKLHVSVCLLLLLTGCASIKSDPVSEVKFWAYAAASIGTAETLHENPELKPHFETALNRLDQLIASGDGNPVALHQIINELPVADLKSRDARIAVQAARLTFARYGQNVTIDLSQRSPYILATAQALRDGIRDGLPK